MWCVLCVWRKVGEEVTAWRGSPEGKAQQASGVFGCPGIKWELNAAEDAREAGAGAGNHPRQGRL